MFQNIASLPDMKMLYYHRQHLSWDWVIAEDIYTCQTKHCIMIIAYQVYTYNP